MNYEFVAIEGNIGSGKTSLAKILAEKYNGRLILEEFEDNPFLPKFYQDPPRHAFPLELSFLAARYTQVSSALPAHDLFHPLLISDYFFPKTLIFAKNNLNDDEFNLFSRLFHITNQSIPQPELVVYLYNTVENLMTNIKKRGRSYEALITPQYLEEIQSRYLDYFRLQSKLKVVIVDTAGLDFVAREEDLNFVLGVFAREYPLGITMLRPSENNINI
ncbi:MAG: deoxynucleoside kinase [Bacteroidetes bacterium]|nr:deoxynucleoside kinase [Bacteroidota bacterium]MBU1720574.1 deoxynucleoside kinase [Bacteroidota bacterium]